jgi:hypothetical protein
LLAGQFVNAASGLPGNGNAGANPVGNFLALYASSQPAASGLMFPGGLGHPRFDSFSEFFPADRDFSPNPGDDLFSAIGRGLPIGTLGQDRLGRPAYEGNTAQAAPRPDELAVDGAWIGERFAPGRLALPALGVPALETDAGSEGRFGDSVSPESGNDAEGNGAAPHPGLDSEGAAQDDE